ncbi:MAG: UbiA prenyltransferase family protein [Candidatus Poribacteria bacterium]
MIQQPKLEIAKNINVSKVKDNSYVYRIFHIFDYVAILRPILLIPVWTMTLMGYYRAIRNDLSSQISIPFFDDIGFVVVPHSEILITLLLYSLLMGAVYILNQLTDSNADGINGKLYLIPYGHLKKGQMKSQIIILFLVSISISFLYLPITCSILILFSAIMGIAYSVPPIRLKGKPIIDLFANALGFGIVAFSVGWSSKSNLSINSLLDSIPYFLCVSSAFINTTIPDMEGDLRNGDMTTGIYLGIKKSCLLSTMILILVILASLYRRDIVPLIASAVSLPFFIYMTISNLGDKINIKTISLATKISVLTLSLLVSFLIPTYFVILMLTIIFVRIYYRIRFRVNYP